jgi:hypothetical protein
LLLTPPGGNRKNSTSDDLTPNTLQEDLMTKRFLMVTAVLLFANTAFGQFSTNRLDDLAARLSREAADFAENNYRSYSNSFRTNRSDTEAVMLAQQFGSASQLFSRMVNDRRRNSELRDAFQLVQDLARMVERNNLQRDRWYNIQRLLSDTSRELGNDSGGPGYPGSGGPVGSGRMTWKGRVDDDVRIVVRGGTAETQTIGGTALPDGIANFSASLPPRRVSVTLSNKKGRGQISIEQQPSRENDFAVVIRITDPKGGASEYEFELSW